MERVTVARRLEARYNSHNRLEGKPELGRSMSEHGSKPMTRSSFVETVAVGEATDRTSKRGWRG
jgi:hypothetical protein